MHLPESFQPLADERGLTFRVRGLAEPVRTGVIAEVAAWAGAGLALATPSGLFLLGPSSPEYAPYVLATVAISVALSTTVGLVRAARRPATAEAVETEVRIDVQGVHVGAARRGWDEVSALRLEPGALVVEAADGELRAPVEHLDPDERRELAAVLDQAWARFGHRPEEAQAAERAARRLRERVSR